MTHGRMASLVIGVALGAAPASAGVPTTTSTTTASTTTSTTLPPACAEEQTFESAHCRLDALAAAIAAEPGLGSIAGKLGNAVDIADRNVVEAETECVNGDRKTAGKKLKKAVRRLIQYGHRLRSLKSRKNIPAEVRGPFVDEGRAIQKDLQALKKALVCPPASPSGAFL
jgi:hypothetical protein